ncbi:hypothetical protein FHS83_000213 [Rhizomicrobium palustre]|uniref:Capsule assembly Wzi family protein n=1 Tax=Rhizomicrobium palustre TaxID=189966 RepID=A0A846MUI3_9PROT|nr:hypothetical protein [Rhizomicrobium palustre]
MRALRFVASLGTWAGLAGAAFAGNWTDIQDAQLRSDIELLASAGLIDNIAMHWPLPWQGLKDSLETAGGLGTQPGYIQNVADRVLQQSASATQRDHLRTELFWDATGSPAVVRGYGALGRATLQSQVSMEYMWRDTTVHLSLGAQSVNKFDHQVFVPDGSYIAQRLGDTYIYAGYLQHWWGPGWISALPLSTNARPIPQIGISRVSTEAFESPWLSWLGPWHFEFFVGVLDGPRVAHNTIYDGLRFAFNPLPGLEIGVSRTDMMCGSGHPCKPIAGYFDPRNDPSHTDIVNDEGSIDIRYTGAFKGLNYSVYTQLLNEDTNPFVHSGTAHLYGASVWHGFDDVIGRLTVEYADSTASMNMFGGSAWHGAVYNNYSYIDGMRYRGRTLGFSLDSDSRLMTVQASLTDAAQRSFTLTYSRVRISDPLNSSGNVVTTSPVSYNLGQARFSLPLRFTGQNVRLDLEGRFQDDQPRPNRGSMATAEAALRIGL